MDDSVCTQVDDREEAEGDDLTKGTACMRWQFYRRNWSLTVLTGSENHLKLGQIFIPSAYRQMPSIDSLVPRPSP